MLKKKQRVIGDIYRWEIQLRTPSGRIHKRIEATSAEAHRIYSELMDQRARMEMGLAAKTHGGQITLEKSAAAYQSALVQDGKDRTYVADTDRALDLLRSLLGDAFPLTSLTREHIRQWRAARAKQAYRGRAPSPRTCNKSLACLSAWAAWCAREGWLDSNPVEFAGKSKEIPPPVRWISWKDYTEFSSKAWTERPALGLFIEVLAETGCRVDELMRAKAADVDAGKAVWTRTVKPGKRLSADAGAWTLFARIRSMAAFGAQTPLCPAEDGRRWTYNQIRRAFELWAPPGCTPHYLRHARACWDLADGKSIWEVKTKLGHSTVTVTERYLRAAELARREDGVESHCKGLEILASCAPDGVLFQKLTVPSGSGEERIQGGRLYRNLGDRVGTDSQGARTKAEGSEQKE